MSYYTNAGTNITEQVLAIKKEMGNKTKSPNYPGIEKTLDLIEKQLNTLVNNYNKNLNQYSKFVNITPNMRNAVVMKRDGILKNLKEKRAATKIQAVTRGVINRRKAADMRAENNRLRANITARLDAILKQIGHNNKSPQ